MNTDARIVVPVLVAALLGACSGQPGGAPAPSASACICPPAPSASQAAAAPKRSEPEFESGEGEILVEKHIPEVWVPHVEAWDLAIYKGSLFWSSPAGVHERPFDGEARDVLAAEKSVYHLVADEDGVVFDVVSAPDRFEIRQISGAERAPRRLAAMPCKPLQLALARSFVVVASTCAISAVPRQGGAPRQIEPDTHLDVSITADRDRLCYVNDHRLSCRSLVDTKAEPMVLDALRPGPLLLDRQILYSLEEGRAADVVGGDEYGRLVRWDVFTGDRAVLTSWQLETLALHRDDRAIYYGTGGGSIRRVTKDGRQVQTLYNVGRQERARMALGPEHIYFATYSDKGIRRFRFPVER